MRSHSLRSPKKVFADPMPMKSFSCRIANVKAHAPLFIHARACSLTTHISFTSHEKLSARWVTQLYTEQRLDAQERKQRSMAAAPAVRSSVEALSPVADVVLREGAQHGVHIKKHLAAHVSDIRPSSSSSLFEAETDMSTPLLPPGDIDWGSDDDDGDKSPPLEYPNSSPMHLITSTTARVS